MFSNTATGPINATASIPGNTGLFTGETLASGTPVLPTLAVPYTATVLAPRQLTPATGGPTTPFTVPTATGGLLFRRPSAGANGLYSDELECQPRFEPHFVWCSWWQFTRRSNRDFGFDC